MSCFIGGTKNTLPHSLIVHVCPVVSGTVELPFVLQQWNTSGASIWVGVVVLLL